MKHILLFTLSLVILSACKQEQDSLLPGVKGAANEIVIVMKSDFWESETGDAIRLNISEYVSGLPMEEPRFNFMYVPHSNFDRVYKRQRNIIITKISPEYPAKLHIQKDTWAKTQIVLTITAPNEEAFIELYNERAAEINDIISNAELKRLQNAQKANPAKDLVARLKSNHEIDLTIPKGYKLNIDSSNFVYMLNEYRDIIEGILVYYYPYTDTNTFSNEFLVKKRDEIGKKYVPGEVDGSYMATEPLYELDAYEYNLKGNRYTKELRGLWKIVNGKAMGGPFVSITQYDEARQRIVTVEGFVFAPGHNKRNLVRRVEAVLYSLDFPE